LLVKKGQGGEGKKAIIAGTLPTPLPKKKGLEKKKGARKLLAPFFFNPFTGF